jgi:hypothetical protein
MQQETVKLENPIHVKVDETIKQHIHEHPLGASTYIEKLVTQDIEEEQTREQLSSWEDEGGSPSMKTPRL